MSDLKLPPGVEYWNPTGVGWSAYKQDAPSLAGDDASSLWEFSAFTQEQLTYFEIGTKSPYVLKLGQAIDFSSRFLSFLGIDLDSLQFEADSASQTYLNQLVGNQNVSALLEHGIVEVPLNSSYHPRMDYNARTRLAYTHRMSQTSEMSGRPSEESEYQFATAVLSLDKKAVEQILHQSVELDPENPPRLVAARYGRSVYPLGIEIPQRFQDTVFVDLTVVQSAVPHSQRLPVLRDIYLHATAHEVAKVIPASGGLHLNRNIRIAGSSVHEAIQYPRVFNLDNPYAQNLLEVVLPHLSEGQRVLDVGSGGGIVSVVAAKDGRADVDAVDILDQAVDNTLLNAQLAGVGDRVRAWKSNLLDAVQDTYDAVMFIAPLAVTYSPKDLSPLVGFDEEDSGWASLVGGSLFGPPAENSRHPGLDFLPEINKIDDNAVNVYDLDGELMLRFLRELPSRLKEKGAAYVMSIPQLPEFAAAFGISNLEYKTLRTFQVGSRYFAIHRISPKIDLSSTGQGSHTRRSSSSLSPSGTRSSIASVSQARRFHANATAYRTAAVRRVGVR